VKAGGGGGGGGEDWGGVILAHPWCLLFLLAAVMSRLALVNAL
jgi:hypothetical protein